MTALHTSRVAALFPPGRLTLREVGLRDGLQLVRRFPDTDAKRQWLMHEHAAGVRVFEIGSFLPARGFPQFADVGDMVAAVKALPGARAAALTLNERGAEDALRTGVDEMIFVLSATEGHSQANTRRSRGEALALLARIAAMRDAAGPDAPVLTAGIAMAFGCSIEGEVDAGEVLRLAEACARAGADVIALADTVGYAGPREVAALASALPRSVGDIPLAMHFHDTRGLAIANAAAALNEGVRILDGSLGGLGGCPFAPGATGNVVFEDLVFLCETMGFDTGINIEALADARRIVARAMPDETLYGALARSGLPKTAAWRVSRVPA
ncbi:hydroxymethylglutaryl-CoA lyase [Allopusillimonas soli]|uniref:Hydroxymethylglutaryl-CoA lyase n=1 Tax=Allopusillimonas soli TaxID=659016 RepID=A0A853FB24_9BURK|nr:hydroxymethylglutaryl-CoA lyase [Allopusillimonas soli]NYT37177.1 hydroxymethylglutaryl-CoA lyase [Allopusillimonas soli]TEA74821.1 hydroxymethylglutaryl-CoA lyase [Allopusillimonas soli]